MTQSTVGATEVSFRLWVWFDLQLGSKIICPLRPLCPPASTTALAFPVSCSVAYSLFFGFEVPAASSGTARRSRKKARAGVPLTPFRVEKHPGKQKSNRTGGAQHRLRAEGAHWRYFCRH